MSATLVIHFIRSNFQVSRLEDPASKPSPDMNGQRACTPRQNWATTGEFLTRELCCQPADMTFDDLDSVAKHVLLGLLLSQNEGRSGADFFHTRLVPATGSVIGPRLFATHNIRADRAWMNETLMHIQRQDGRTASHAHAKSKSRCLPRF